MSLNTLKHHFTLIYVYEIMLAVFKFCIGQEVTGCAAMFYKLREKKTLFEVTSI